MNNRQPNKIFAKIQRGQGMVEFALVIPFLLVVLLGVIEFGFFFFVYSSINSAAREAVRFGSGAGPSAIGVPYYQYCQGIRDTARRVGAYAGMADAEIQIGYDSGPGTNQDWTLCLPDMISSAWDPAAGDRVVVRISLTYDPIISMLGFPPIQVNAQSARTILRSLEIEATPLASITEQGGGGQATATEVGGGSESDTPTPIHTPTHTSTPSRTPTLTATCKFKDPSKCDYPEVCMTPLELGGCE